ncbi:MAG: peroxidase family protein [Pirellulales bacterium]
MGIFRQLALALTALPLFALVAAAEDRSIDGTGNNVNTPTRGAANTPMVRSGYSSQFKDSTGAMLTDADRANARDISNAIFAQSESLRSARNLSDFVWAWGQFVSHDTDLTTTSDGAATNGYAPIAVNGANDPLGPNAIPFVRANYEIVQGRGGGRTPINEVTSYIDASTVYGSDPTRAAALRTGGGAGAKLLTGASDLLPYNSAGLPVENNGPLPNTQLFLAGDIRANENALLTALHTVFTREHNRLVDIIAAQQPALNEEQQYQLARKIVGAEVQAITYKEFLPALLGTSSSVPKAEQYNYSAQQTAEITTAFAQAGFRYGHSSVSSQLQLVNDGGAITGTLAVRNAFYNPTIIGSDPRKVDELLKGAATQVSEEVDTLVVDELRSFLFGPPGAGGLDLAALNIQRGRDVGLPNYLQLKKSRQAGPFPTDFNGITSDPQLAQALSTIYAGNINNIDAWVGMLAEDHVAGASVGSLLKREIEEQFRRLRDGDRLFYRADVAGLYTAGTLNSEIAAIIDLDNWRLSDFLAANTAITSFQQNVFFVPGTGDFNGDGQVGAADFTVWRDTQGQTGPGLAADADHNGQVDVEDYNLWKQLFGSQYAAAGGGSITSVPEPPLIALTVMFLFLAAMVRSRVSCRP